MRRLGTLRLTLALAPLVNQIIGNTGNTGNIERFFARRQCRPGGANRKLETKPSCKSLRFNDVTCYQKQPFLFNSPK
jgi:hypothetical protein